MERQHPAEQLATIMTRIYERGLTTTSGGNLSIKDEDGNVWITPGSIDKGTLKATDMVCICPDGTMKGKYKPSREYPFHMRIYELRSDIHAIVHAHPAELVAFAITNTIPDPTLYPDAYEHCGTIGTVAYANPGTKELEEYVGETFATDCDVAVMQNHGEIACGNTMEQAYVRFETFTQLARTHLVARRIGSVNCLSEELLRLFHEMNNHVNKSTENKVENTSYGIEILWITNECKTETITKWRKRAYEHQLITQISGIFVERVTKAENQWEVHTNLACGNGMQNVFQRIMLANPQIGAIILASPTYFTGYACTKEPLDSTIIMESYVLLRYVPRITFDQFVKHPEQLADRIGEVVPVVMIENYGILSTGKNLQEAFDRMEVAENNAKTLVEAKTLGQVCALEQSRIEELDAQYQLI